MVKSVPFPWATTPSLLCATRTSWRMLIHRTWEKESSGWRGRGGRGVPFIPASHLHCNSSGYFPHYPPNINALSSPANTLHQISNLQQFLEESSYFLSLHFRPPLQPPFSNVQPLWCLIFLSFTPFLSHLRVLLWGKKTQETTLF